MPDAVRDVSTVLESRRRAVDEIVHNLDALEQSVKSLGDVGVSRDELIHVIMNLVEHRYGRMVRDLAAGPTSATRAAALDRLTSQADGNYY